MWLGERPLKEVFPRLYRVGCNKEALIGDHYRFEEDQLLWYFDFRRDLRVFKHESLKELLTS